MIELTMPPWNPEPGELEVADDASFYACNQAINTYNAATKNKIVEKRNYLSKKWGMVVRLVESNEVGRRSTFLMNCWTLDGVRVEMMVAVKDDQ